ncbi:ribosomal L1 domain-containing protein 1-like [Centruroides vittatus]|uniref:ribosomal L1 domain-containing protein 1-like n=1 Tax=Centruroides vittatus TaxID=120091 RepID=UPI00350E908C
MASTRVELSKVQISEAVLALKKVEKSWKENKNRKTKLLEDDEHSKKVFLQIGLKKIPEIKSKAVKIYLPHWNLEGEVCLITGDLDKKNPRADPEETVRHYKELLQKHEITCISGVISLRELHTDYKEYEARRKLCNAYDIFLTDRKIFASVNAALGKFVYANNKIPRRININSKNLKKEITNALACSICFVQGKGSDCTVCVGHISQPKTELVKNIITAVEKFSDSVMGGWQNIQTLHIKCAKSLAVPFYVSFESPNEVDLPTLVVPNEPIEDELTTLTGGRVKVYPDGEVEVVESKKTKKKQLGKKKTNLKPKSKKIAKKETELPNNSKNDLMNDEMQVENEESSTLKKKVKKRKANEEHESADTSTKKNRKKILKSGENQTEYCKTLKQMDDNDEKNQKLQNTSAKKVKKQKLLKTKKKNVKNQLK